MARGFELEDQPWFPRRLRRMMMEYIGFLGHGLGSYRGLAPVLARAVAEAGADGVLDLASGSGAPVAGLQQSSGLEGVQFILSDLYPVGENDALRATFRDPTSVRWHAEPLDARHGAVDAYPGALRTLLNGYHHFGESDKIRLLEAHGRRGFLVAEILEPTPGCLARVLLATTVGQVILAPFVRPFRWERLFWTWVVPINLFTVTFDGVMSVLRVDTPRRLEARARAHAPSGTQVTAGRSGPWWAPIHWVLVLPKPAAMAEGRP
jgi:hypothetical protein